jgi:hypothetical protein
MNRERNCFPVVWAVRPRTRTTTSASPAMAVTVTARPPLLARAVLRLSAPWRNISGRPMNITVTQRPKVLRLQPTLDINSLRPASRGSVWRLKLRGLVYLASGGAWSLITSLTSALTIVLDMVVISVFIAVGGGLWSLLRGEVMAAFWSLVAFALLCAVGVLLAFTVGTNESTTRTTREWQRYGRLAWDSARRLAAQSAYVTDLLRQQRPYVLLLRDWRSTPVDRVVDTSNGAIARFGGFDESARVIDASAAARWARVAASALPVVALAEPDTFEVLGVVSPAVPRAGWERMAERLIASARSIVVVVEKSSEGAGLDWEIGRLSAGGKLNQALLLHYGDFARAQEFSLVLQNQKFSSAEDSSVDEALVEWILTSNTAALRGLRSFRTPRDQ